jgi:hypothetical protein
VQDTPLVGVGKQLAVPKNVNFIVPAKTKQKKGK